jgi:hypothetical protein
VADAASGSVARFGQRALGSNEQYVERRSHSPRRASYNLEARPWPSEGKSLAGKQALEPRQQSVSNVELLALGSTIASGYSNILVGQAWLGAETPRLDYQQDITPLG